MELGNLIFGNSRGEQPVNRDWQDMFVDKLCEMGFDSYGFAENPKIEKYKKEFKSVYGSQFYKYENDIFIVMPYYWGEDEEISTLPNFVYRPNGFKLDWYKYPLRDSYMNQDITKEELQKMLDHCISSLT